MNTKQNPNNSTESRNDGNTVLPAVYGRKINPMDLFMLDVKSNEFIKKYRSNLGLETPNNRVDTGDLKMIILALHDMGFDVVERLS